MRRRDVSPVRYELRFYIPEDGIFHSHCREYFKSYIQFYSFGFECIQTSTAVASILYQLSQHPQKQEMLYDEIRTIVPTSNTPLTAQRLEQLSYLKACIKETLRYFKLWRTTVSIT
jgi:hypothetical protein